MTYKRKKYHHGDTHLKKRWRVRNRKKDLDQIDVDLKEDNAEKLLNQTVDLDLPGAAQHYCLHCARYFIDEKALSEHFKTKVHKRRLKALELEPYSIEESERAAGLGSFKPAIKRKIVTQNTNRADKTDTDGDLILDDVSPDKKKRIDEDDTLFINGTKATDTFVYLTPHIDFLERIKRRDELEKELANRNANIDLDKLVNLWAVYKDLEDKKNCLDKKKEELSQEITSYIKGQSDGKQVESLKLKLNLIKENIKKIKPPLWSAEEMAIVETLKLPNSLHPLTSIGENKVIHTKFAAPKNSKNHLDIGQGLELLNFIKNENYYLKNDAAVFELGAKFFFSNVLKKKNFVQFSNPDFVKSIIVEGCGEDHTNADSTFILHHNENTKMNIDSRLHLTGAGSLFAFFAYHTKNVIRSKVLPLKYFAMGRYYKPSAEDEDCLFHVSQSSVIQVFETAKCMHDLDALLQELIETVKECYNQLGYHYRLSILAADKLYMWESLRIVIEMYSSSLDTYVEVGNISCSGDFISKRLMFTYTDDNVHKFPHVLSGTILNVPKLLACVLEQDNDFVVPEPFKVENWNKQN